MPRICPLFLMVSALTAMVSGAFVLSAWRDHEATRREAQASLTGMARLMEEHTAAAFLASELQICRIQDMMGQRPPSQATDADAKALRRLIGDWPMVQSAWVFDSDATMRATTYDIAPETMNVGDRAYYTALRDGAARFVSPLIWAKLKPVPLFALSRRLEHPDGSFAGGIVLSVQSNYFIDFYRRLSQHPGAEFGIYKNDGNMVMRSPLPAGHENAARPQALLDHIAQGPNGSYITRSEQDGTVRLYAYRSMTDYPLTVIAGLAVDDVFADWRDRTVRNGLLAAAILAAFLAIAHRLAATLRRESNLRTHAETLLADKEMLFQEVHHRVKNNLHVVNSFLSMQAMRASDPATVAALEEALSRVRSMALVHQTLYQQNEASEVSMDAYLRALVAHLTQACGSAARGIDITVDAADITLSMDKAVPLALVTNEALTNALKHAFPGGRGGSIRAGLRRDGGHLVFSLRDNGIGMESGAGPGLGTTILGALTRQLRGELSWRQQDGTCLEIRFPA